MNIESIREDFPILKRKVNVNGESREIVYFDNAATSQKPTFVIERVVDYYKERNANIHRGIHILSEEATDMYEKSRENVARFIGAKPNELGFTKNSTEGLNIIAKTCEHLLNKDDTIVITIMEHHANLVPWQVLCKRIGCKLEYIYIKKDGTLREDDFNKIEKARVVSIVHVSNVLGTINDVKEIVKMAKDNNAYTFIDGSQSTPHMLIDVKSIGCDGFVFTGHKMLAPMGIGGIYIREDIHDLIQPLLYGGDMINDVSEVDSTFKQFPEVIEGGTPNVGGAIGLSAAVDYLKRIGMENVRKHEIELTKYTISKMQELTDGNILEIYGPTDEHKRAGVISFNVNGKHPTDVAYELSKRGICVRSGMHCAHPLHKYMGINGSVRASFYIYNTKREVDYFIDSLYEITRVR